MIFRYRINAQIFELDIEPSPGGYRARLNGESREVVLRELTPERISLVLDGEPFQAAWAEDGDRRWIALNGRSYALEKLDGRRTRREGESQGGGDLRAPMPGQVRGVLVGEGEPVERGQTILLLEAMKMEMRILAPKDGVVTRLAVKKDEQVDKGDLLAEVQ